MTTTEYGIRAARKYVTAHAAQNASRYTVGCPMTHAEGMLAKYVHACRLEGTPCPEYGQTGNHQTDVLMLAAGILATV